MFNPFSTTPPLDEMKESRIKGEAQAELMQGLMSALESGTDDERMKTEIGILLRVSKLHSATNQFARFADPRSDKLTLEQKKAAKECLDNALVAFNAFLSINPIPENTIFD